MSSASRSPRPPALGPIARSGDRGARPLSCSFEFFPPKSAEAEEKLVGGDRQAQPAVPRVRQRHLRRGRLHARAHAPHRQAHPGRDDAEARRPPDLRRRLEGRGGRGDPRLLGGGGAPHRGAGEAILRTGAGIGGVYRPRPDGYANATELTRAITRIAPFEISVGAYPEAHPETGSIDRDLDVLKAKVDAGATRAISQFFFDTDAFLRFVERAQAAGIAIPILPGVMPVTNFKGLARMCGACGASIPPWLATHFDGLDDDPDTRRLVAVTIAAEMCAKLEEQGFSDFHFYTLNRADLVYAICRMLGGRERATEAAA